MTAALGARLRALLTDLGVPHPGTPDPQPREHFLPDATIRSSTDPVPVMVEAPGVPRESLSTAGLHAQREGLGTVVAGAIRADLVPSLAEVPGVLSIGLEDPGRGDIHSSVPATRATAVREGTLGLTGSGVIVGVVDSGIDIFHQAFRKADGKTRIISLLDTTNPHRIKGEGGPTAGTFQIGWVPPAKATGAGVQQLTPPLAHNATASQVRAALETIGAIDPGDVAVTGGPLPGTPVTIHFQGQYLHRTLNRPTVNNQSLTPSAATMVFERGQVYDEGQINTALGAPPNVFMSWDSLGHGTHVMGIAGGDGSQAGNCHLADYYVGVAPEADLVAVKTDWTDAQTLEGIRHVFTTADNRSIGATHPVAAVVNLSLTGEHSGARDGTTQLEKDIDGALAANPPGRVIVKSAGNNGRLHDFTADPQKFWPGSATHSSKTVPASSSATMSVRILAKDKRDDTFDFWYRGAGRIDLGIQLPGNPPVASGSAPASATSTTLTLDGHPILVQSLLDSPDPGTHHVFVRISPRPSGTIRAGTWIFTLTETAGTETLVHCWIGVEKTDKHPRFVNADLDRLSTLTPPGTAHRIITVANYDHTDTTVYESSSRGPTTDPRTGFDTKPDIAAPGTGIMAAKAGGSDTGICCDCCYDVYTSKTGTSMAAPHVTGIIALLLERNHTLTWEQIRAHLRDTADPPDPSAGTTLPDHEWGAGIVNAEAAAASVPAFVADGDPAYVGTTIDDGAPRGGSGPTTDGPTTTSPRRPRAPVPLSQLREVALRSATGQLVFSLVSTHLSEGVRLVNTDRRTTVAWHRMGGPALLRDVLDTPADAAPRIPSHVDGRDLREGLSRFLDELARAGSLPLRTDVERHRALLESLPGTSLDALDELHVAG